MYCLLSSLNPPRFTDCPFHFDLPMATVDSTSTCSFKSIQTVDLHLLSQSELHALSLCSDGALNSRFCDDLVIPKIDRSVFNESAGSRKQTYSRLRLAPASSSSTTTTTIRRRTPHLRNSRPPPDTSIDNDPERAENSRIIHLLKELFAKEGNVNDFLQVPVDYSNSVLELSNVEINAKKRKRGRPRKDTSALVPVPLKVEGGFDVIKDIFYNENVEDRDIDIEKDRDIVNKNSAVVNLVALGGLSDPYGPELRRRTEGMETAEELLGFLSGLNGQWGSRRKKRMVVDANEFGDVLPSSWKLLLALKRKEGHVWLICRRYISPTGRQFVSCKDVSLYLLSICGTQNIGQPNLLSICGTENTGQPNCGQGNDSVTYGNDAKDVAEVAFKEDHEKEKLVCPSLSPSTSGNVSNDRVVVHTKNDANTTETSLLLIEGQSIEPVISGIVPQTEPLIQEPIERESKDTDICEASLNNDGPNTDKFDHDLNCLPCDKHDSQGTENEKISAKESSDKDNYCTMNIDEMRVADDEALDDMPVAIENSETNVSTCAEDQNKETVCEDTIITSSKDEQFNGIDHMNGVTETLLVESENKDTAICGAEDNLNRVSTTTSASPKVDELFNFESNECGSYAGSDIDAMNTLVEEKTFEKTTLVSPWGEQVNVIGNFGNEVSLQGRTVTKESESGLISEKGFQSGPMVSPWSDQVHVIENYGNEVSTCTVEGPTQQKKTETSLISLFDYEQSCSVEDYVDEVSTKTVQDPPKFDQVQTSAKEKNLEFCSLVPSEIEQSFGGIADNHELSLAFGDPHAGIYTDPNVVDQTFGVETSLSRVNNNMVVDDPKQERGSIGGLFSLSFNGGFENNLESVYGVENSASNNNKFMMGFGSGDYGQPDDGVWRSGAGNMLQSGLADTSNALLQPSSSFCTFDIMSDKAQVFNSGFEGLRPGRSEPIEFSFLTEQNSNSLQRDNNNNHNKSFSYDTRMGREFDSSFWLGRDALMPNIGGASSSSSSRRGQISTICVWCRNQFLQEPVNFGTQAAIGPVCPTCRARFSGHVNLL